MLAALASLRPKRRWILTLVNRFPDDRLAQDLDLVQIDLQRKALLGRSEGDDDFALVTKFHHDPLHTREHASMHAYDFPDGNCRMGPQDASAGQSFADPIDFNGAHRFAHATSQQAQNAGCAHDGHPYLAREPHKNIACKERAFQVDYAIGPFGSHRIEGKIMLKGARRQMLCNPLFMVCDNMQNPPGTFEHRPLQYEPYKSGKASGLPAAILGAFYAFILEMLSVATFPKSLNDPVNIKVNFLRQQCKYIPEVSAKLKSPISSDTVASVDNWAHTMTHRFKKLPQQRDELWFLEMKGVKHTDSPRARNVERGKTVKRLLNYVNKFKLDRM